MESKLLVGGKNIVDHTNEQQKILELKRQEIAEQVKFPTCITRQYKDCSGLCFNISRLFQSTQASRAYI